MLLKPFHENSAERPTPLAFHIRRLRQWYGSEGLTQKELAAIAGVHLRTVEFYERTTKLPAAVNSFLAIMIALRQTSEIVVAPHLLDSLHRDIEARRTALHQAPDVGSVLRGELDAL